MPDGSEYIKEEICVDMAHYEEAGKNLAQIFIQKGAKELLQRAEQVAFQ